MSGTRFVRSGRCRLFISLLAVFLVFGLIAIFHSSQQQLDETREQRLRCEQQQESLNVRLQTIVEQKYEIEKSQEHERKELLETNKNLEQKLNAQRELYVKKEMEANERFEELQNNFKHLQSEYNQLVESGSKTRKQYIEKTESLDKQLQSLKNDLHREKSIQGEDVQLWKEKYNSMLHENQRLETITNSSISKLVPLQEHIKYLEDIVAEYKSTNGSKLRIEPINRPGTTRNAFLPDSSLNKSKSIKSFNEQPVSPNLFPNPKPNSNKTLVTFTVKASEAEQNLTKTISNIASNTSSALKTNIGVGSKSLTNEQTALLQENRSASLPFSALNNHSLFVPSVENFQIIPNTERKLSLDTQERRASPLSSPLKQMVKNEMKSSNVGVAIHSTASSSSSSVAPLAPLPFKNIRKLPDNVAPIPENLDELLKNQPSEKLTGDRLENGADVGDIDAAVEDLQKNDVNSENNRYANIVSDLEQGGEIKAVVNEDSGAHEIKDHDLINFKNFNLPVDTDNNSFFAGGAVRNEPNVVKKHKAFKGNDVINTGIGIADEMNDDIAIKNHNALDAENVNNEVIRDQGKEFPEGINLEDGNDEDEDDDYSNPAARQQGEQAVRN